IVDLLCTGQPSVLCGAGWVRDDSVRDGELYARPRRGADRNLQGWFHGAAGAHCVRYSGCAVLSMGRYGPCAVGAGLVCNTYSHSPHPIYLCGDGATQVATYALVTTKSSDVE